MATEAYTLAYGYSYQLPVLASRFFNVFGPLQTANHVYAAVIPSFVDAALAGRPLMINGDGTQEPRLHLRRNGRGRRHRCGDPPNDQSEPINLAFDPGSRCWRLLTSWSAWSDIASSDATSRHDPAMFPTAKLDITRLRALFGGIQPVPFADGLPRQRSTGCGPRRRTATRLARHSLHHLPVVPGTLLHGGC